MPIFTLTIHYSLLGEKDKGFLQKKHIILLDLQMIHTTTST